MAVQRCQACGLINPARALRCDCGRSFVDGSMGATLESRMAAGDGDSTCPKCRRAVVPRELTFTWWGGMLGPRLFHHVECPACGVRYNGKTRRSNDTAITLYLIVVTALAVMVYALLRS